MQIYNLETREFSGTLHNGERADIEIQGEAELLSVGRGDYGAVYGAIAKINGDLTEVALKIYGQGVKKGAFSETQKQELNAAWENDEEYEAKTQAFSTQARDRAFARYQGIQQVLPEHTFQWGIQTENHPSMILPLERNIIAGNDLPRFKAEQAFGGPQDYSPYFSEERKMLLRSLCDGEITTLENWEEALETLKIMAETATQIGIFLNDAYFWNIQKNRRSKKKIKITPFLGDFDDSYRDLSNFGKQMQHAMSSIDDDSDVLAFNQGQIQFFAFSFLEQAHCLSTYKEMTSRIFYGE